MACKPACSPSTGSTDICSCSEEPESEECGCCKKTCIIKREPSPLAYLIPADLRFVSCIAECRADVIIVVGPEIPCELQPMFDAMRCMDKAFDKVLTLFSLPGCPYPIIYSPLVDVTAYHDVRVYHNAACLAFKRLLLAQFESPLLILPRCPLFPNGDLVTILGALHALYIPLHMREESTKDKVSFVEVIYLLAPDDTQASCLCFEISTLEPGRYVYRDLAMADPERMTPIRFEDYVYELFKTSKILIEIVCEPLVLLKDFPLFNAVNRGAHRSVPRYHGRIVFLEYVPGCVPLRTILIVGKGVTFDTGGMSLKINGSEGMSRDKSGAANAVGFITIANILKPNFIHIIAALPLTRNIIGEHGYATDEIVVSRAGVHVRFSNTDAEGRVTMSDSLTFFKEQVIARNLPEPHLFTIGTMTQHARTSVGDGYPIVVDNSVAREEDHAYKLKALGTAFGEPHELYLLRKDDFDINIGKVIGEDLVQKECDTGELTFRAHQITAAFMLQSTRLTQHEMDSCFPIKFTHIDMVGNAVNYPYIPGSQPLFAMAKTHLTE